MARPHPRQAKALLGGLWRCSAPCSSLLETLHHPTPFPPSGNLASVWCRARWLVIQDLFRRASACSGPVPCQAAPLSSQVNETLLGEDADAPDAPEMHQADAVSIEVPLVSLDHEHKRSTSPNRQEPSSKTNPIHRHMSRSLIE